MKYFYTLQKWGLSHNVAVLFCALAGTVYFFIWRLILNWDKKSMITLLWENTENKGKYLKIPLV